MSHCTKSSSCRPFASSSYLGGCQSRGRPPLSTSAKRAPPCSSDPFPSEPLAKDLPVPEGIVLTHHLSSLKVGKVDLRATKQIANTGDKQIANCSCKQDWVECGTSVRSSLSCGKIRSRICAAAEPLLRSAGGQAAGRPLSCHRATHAGSSIAPSSLVMCVLRIKLTHATYSWRLNCPETPVKYIEVAASEPQTSVTAIFAGF